MPWLSLIIFCASYLYLVILIIGLVSFLRQTWKKKVAFLKLLIPTSVIAYLLGKLTSHIISSPRPFIVEHIKPLIHAATDNGFPSDHMLLSVTVALVVFNFNKKVGTLLILLACLVGSARVLAHVHHLQDVIGSTVIAIFALGITMLVLKKVGQIE